MNNPILIPGWPRDWPCQKWTFQSLADLLKDNKFSCRVWKKSNARVFETNCEHVNVTLTHFCDWLTDKASLDNPLHHYGRKEYNCYIDYKYMKDMFESASKVLEDVKWCDFGLSDLDGYDSTIWIGSEGANTPCHQDSYGFNVVTQIQGRKLWVLFPPSDASCLYATRIPYEESSVFSEVDIKNPDLREHPHFKFSHPVVVVLSPGQCLYVPHLWWHYVESLEPSISINVWVSMEQDKHQHVNEAITRCLATCLITNLDASENCPVRNQLVNPTENLYPSKVNYKCLKTALETLNSSHSPGAMISENSSKKADFDHGKPYDECHVDEEQHHAQRSMAGVHHYEEFQKWINQCDVIEESDLLISSSKRRFSFDVSHRPKKMCKRESEIQEANQLSDGYFCESKAVCKDCDDANAVQIEVEHEKTNNLDDSPPEIKTDTKDTCRPHNTNLLRADNPRLSDRLSSESSMIKESSSYQKHKINLLKSIPFRDFQETLQKIFHSYHYESHGQILGTDLGNEGISKVNEGTNQSKQSPSSELSLHQTSPNMSEKLNDISSISSKLSSVIQKDGPQETFENKISLTDSELARSFISSVLHPSVINRISDLLKENYQKEIRRRHSSDFQI